METLLTQAASFLEQLKTPQFYIDAFTLLATPGWWQLLLCFLTSSGVMIYCLNAIEKNGFEGTLVGTLIMPYFSGFPNLCFAYLMAKKGSTGAVVLENCLVNNLTTLTIILALPAIFWGLNLFQTRHLQESEMKINRLSLLLSLLAMAFFSAAVFTLSRDGQISQSDGLILVGLFLFWQLYHVFDVLKNKTRKERRIHPRIWLDLLIIGLCAWGIFSSIDNLVDWVSSRNTGLISKQHLGLLSGILMVMPNALLAVYYASIRRSDIAYSSQIGDCHICIPLCIGIYAAYSTIPTPPAFVTALGILTLVAGFHFLFLAILGKLPRLAGVLLVGVYGFIIYKGAF